MREYIQTALNTLTDIDSGNFQPDGIIEAGTTYFGYQLTENYQESDFDKNDTRRVSILGFITRKTSSDENTLEIIDEASETVRDKLKELNFKISLEDVTLTDEIRKIKVTGYVYYNSMNNNLVI